jgi:CheY-like chemotaxis protein
MPTTQGQTMTAVLNALRTWALPAQPQHRAMTAGGPPAPGQEESGSGEFQDTRPAQPVVLLVEDNHINQVVALEFLALMGLQTQLAKNGFEAIEACLIAAPDLVLMDIQMPGMDGLECTRRLRELQAESRLPSFPILALTAHALESDVQASKDAGMNEHLTKPLDFATLRTRLGRWLDMPGIN